MCLALPGRILTIASHPPAGTGHGRDADAAWAEAGDDDPLWRVAEVDFGGVRQLVSLACLPEARAGDEVLVHVGLAISLVRKDGAEASGGGADRHQLTAPEGVPQG